MAGIGGWAGQAGGGDARPSARRDKAALASLVGGAATAVCWVEEGAGLAWAPRGRGHSLHDMGAPPRRDGLAVADDLVVAFEGTLVERATLRTFVERRGLVPTRGHDAELILLAWRELGSAALDRIEGTFALAVWSRARRELLLARDRLGGYSLAWSHGAGGVAFAGDLAALVRWVEAPRDEARMFEVLLQGHVSPPHTLYRGVRVVEPGYTVRFDAHGTTRATRYFAPSFIPRAEVLEALGQRLATVTDAHIALGTEGTVLLDGSIGGAAIAHAAQRGAAAALDTSSIHVAGELDVGAQQARALGTRHEVVELVPEAISMADAVRAHGGPFATVAPLVAGALRHHPIVYAGAGAETLAGFPARVAEVTRGSALAPWAGRALRRGSELVADVTLSPLRPWFESMAALGGASEQPLGHRLLVAEGVFPPDVLAAIVRPRWHSALFDITAWSDRMVDEATADSALGRGLARRLRGHVAEELLPGLDRALRAGGAELRLPFLDRRWIEQATGLLPADRGRALRHAIPEAVPFEPDVGERLLARWMGGALEQSWREAVFAETSPLADLIDLPRVRALLLAEVAWNPGRWRQALALWTLSLWISA